MTEIPKEDENEIQILCIPDLIIKKRDGKQLTKKEIEFFIRCVTEGSIQPAQLGAMLMVIYIQELSEVEVTHLTQAMTSSGEILKWPQEWRGSIVDKHSTGGVGDKTSIILAPALAACGCKVPMVSGRGLGFTGGTLDKLESIPGFKTSLTNEEMVESLDEVGCCIVGQTANLVPADKIMYSTRDVTGTADSLSLIAASIISKKAAEQLDALVLDVKTGLGASMKTEHGSQELAHMMVNIGKCLGVKTVAFLTDMNSPLGMAVGNSLEIIECLGALHGEGVPDLIDLVIQLGAQLLMDCGKARDKNEATNRLTEVLNNGSAAEKFCAMMKKQGVDPDLANKLCLKGSDIRELLPRSKFKTELKSQKSGYVQRIDAMTCALVSNKLGAGRDKTDDQINFGVGLEILFSVGQKIKEGDSWIRVHHDEDVLSPVLEQLLVDGLSVDSVPVSNLRASRVIDIIT
ncbi:hypothetical protein ACJMK2_029789 [Sinanodonta woodiana]|uniref:Thymidine phosphorylase n=1 Tax=Sinanodonta woodiana TaxID=1069815 RepID=A0ABD3XDL3_SINWO